ncbi:MAG: hypothetical protein ACXAB7_20805 [Candidatus Kariarchaeaceae archaeon]|jgi:hypothetical protein
MVGNVDALVPKVHDFFSQLEDKIGIRQLIILSLGPMQHPISPRQAYSLTNYLANQIPRSYRHSISSFSTYQNMLTKLTNQGVIRQIRLPEKDAYGVVLSEFGLGEFDWALHSLEDSKFHIAFTSYSEYLISLS